jgi:hypothetical protein
MRINETTLVQLVESNPPQLVILDDNTGAEIALDHDEVERLLIAIEYFIPTLFHSNSIPNIEEDNNK